MCRIPHRIAVIVIVVAAVSSSAMAQDSSPLDGEYSQRVAVSPEVEKRILELRKDFARVHEAAESGGEIKTTVRALATLVTRDPEGDVTELLLKCWAIDRLTRFPDVLEAVEALVGQIDFGGEAIERDSPLGPYPAAAALTKVGTPARRCILASLGVPHSDHRLRLMAYVLMELDQGGEVTGSDVAITVFRLTRELELVKTAEYVRNETRDAKSKNLRRMITMLLEPGFRAKTIPRRPNESPRSKRTDSEASLIEQFLEQERKKQP